MMRIYSRGLLLFGLIVSPGFACAQKIIGSATQSASQKSPSSMPGVQSSITRDYNPALSARIHVADGIANTAMARLEHGGDTAKAIVELKRALAIFPSHKRAYLALGQAYARKGRITEALQSYRKYIFAGSGKNWQLGNSNEPLVLAEFALLLAQTGQQREALEIYERARPNTSAYIRSSLPVFGTEYKTSEFGAAVHTIIGDALLLTNRRDRRNRALTELRKAAVLNPHLLIVRFRLGEELVDSGQFAEAKPHLELVAHQGQGEMKHSAESCLAWIKQKRQSNKTH